MTATARYDRAVEARVIDDLRPHYEGRGYDFVAHPKPSNLPPFMQGYVPDAIATNDRESIAIEVKASPSSGLSNNVEWIRGLFAGRQDWKFAVVYGGADPQRSIDLPVVERDVIEQRVSEAERLARDGFGDAALLTAFSLLEATLQRVDRSGDRRPRRPDTVVQSLAMEGFVGAEEEQRLRELVRVRNRVVHGDFTSTVTPDEVLWLLDIIKNVLNFRPD